MLRVGPRVIRMYVSDVRPLGAASEDAPLRSRPCCPQCRLRWQRTGGRLGPAAATGSTRSMSAGGL
jgi:hypothetical protein